jgi:CelD/BcsL family acetyltransferase involved in cellulose biosynthesis
MSGELAVGEIRAERELSLLAPEWWDLWRRAAAATPFQSPAWLLSWWRCFAPGELFVLHVRRGGRLVGLAPFYIETGARGGRILPIGVSVSDYLDILVDPAESAAGAAIVERVRAAWKLWDQWELPDLPPGAAARRLPCPPDWNESAGPCAACPVLALPPGAGGLRQVLPSKKRRSVQMARNRAARRGAVEIAAADPATAPKFLADLIRLHQARWESVGEPGVLGDERVRRMHAAALPDLLQAGIARMYAIEIAGETAAVYYGFIHRRRAYAYLTGFDPRYAFESPGSLIVAHAIEEALREGAREFHFLRGDEAYKYGWGATDRDNVRRTFRRRRDVQS